MGNADPLLLRANAGTGKTFRLSNRYLALLIAGEKPDKILATTFTKKAAGEIQARIFTRLAEAASSDAAALRLSRELECDPISKKRALELLHSLVVDQHRLAICTLDSLCVKLLQMFAIEAGFSQGVRISTNEQDAELITATVSGLIAGEATSNLDILLRLLAGGRDKRSIQKRLEAELRSCHQLFLESEMAAWHSIDRLPSLRKSELAQAIENLKALPPVPKADGTPDLRLKKGIDGDYIRAQAGEWGDFLKTGIAKSLFAGSLTYSSVPIPDEYATVYKPILAHACAEILDPLIHRTAALYALLSDYDAAYWKERRAAGTLNFTDVKQVLEKAAVLDALSELYFRLDSTYAHLLLDEFQDTSLVEWRIVEPIAAEILSKASGNQNSFLCVGDVKQAIYGWRGGVAEIFDSVLERWQGVITPEYLTESYRSAPVLMEFVNRVFEGVAQLSVLSPYRNVAEIWQNRFTKHSSALQDLKGFITVQAVSVDGEEKGALERELSRSAVSILQRIHRANPNLTIGVLVPRNQDVRRVVRELLAVGIAASEEGGALLLIQKRCWPLWRSLR